MHNRAQFFRTKKQTRQKELAVRVTLPSSGAEVLLHRPSLEVWMMSGRIPQALTQKVLEMFGSGEKPKASEVLKRMQEEGGKALQDSLIFVRDLVSATLVSPRLIVPSIHGREADPEKDEIDPTDLETTDFAFIFSWAVSGSAGVPVTTTEGSVSVDALSNFSVDGRGDSAGADQPEVRRAA